MRDKEPHERWLARGTGVGLLLGALLGIALGDVVVGLMIGLILGSGVGVLSDPRNRRHRDERAKRRRSDRHGSDDGAIDRGLLWLLIGLAVAVLLMLASAPELLDAQASQLGGLAIVLLAAAVPGIAIVAVVAFRRRGRTDDEEV